MEWPTFPLHLDPEQSLSDINNLIQDKFQQLNRRLAVSV